MMSRDAWITFLSMGAIIITLVIADNFFHLGIGTDLRERFAFAGF
jgi:hypothetical protein